MLTGSHLISEANGYANTRAPRHASLVSFVVYLNGVGTRSHVRFNCLLLSEGAQRIYGLSFPFMAYDESRTSPVTQILVCRCSVEEVMWDFTSSVLGATLFVNVASGLHKIWGLLLN